MHLDVAAFHRANAYAQEFLAGALAEDRGDDLLGAIEHAVRFTAIAGIGWPADKRLPEALPCDPHREPFSGRTTR
jgi:hypothetical protein